MQARLSQVNSSKDEDEEKNCLNALAGLDKKHLIACPASASNAIQDDGVDESPSEVQ